MSEDGFFERWFWRLWFIALALSIYYNLQRVIYHALGWKTPDDKKHNRLCKAFDVALETISLRDELEHEENMYEVHRKYCKFKPKYNCPECQEHKKKIWNLSNRTNNHEQMRNYFESKGLMTSLDTMGYETRRGPDWAKEWSSKDNWWSKE